MTTTGHTTTTELDTPADVLGFARDRRAAANAAEADVLLAAVTWAEQHPPESIHTASTWVAGGGDTGLPLAGPGAPLVAEFCLAEFAAALGVSTDAGRALVAEAVELKHRLPRLWGRVQSHELVSWRARRIAQATLGLSMEAAGFVDAQVAAFAHRTGPAQLDRLVAESIARFMPDHALADAARAADTRHFRIHHDHVSFNGTSHIEAELDLADALDLDAALTRGAASLKAGGCTETLDVRRSIAAGDLARRQLTLELGDAAPDSPAAQHGTTARQVVLYVHLSEAAITGTSTELHLARVENHRQGVTADQVRTWCANPDTTVTVKPVIDLTEHIAVDAYEVPDRAPRADRSARPQLCLSLVHPTSPDIRPRPRHSLAPRLHHHRQPRPAVPTTSPPQDPHPWTYTVLEPGTYLWSSPHGYQHLRDHHGTRDVSGRLSDRRPSAGP